MYYKYPAIESKQIASISIEHIRCGIVAPSIVRLVSIHLHISTEEKTTEKTVVSAIPFPFPIMVQCTCAKWTDGILCSAQMHKTHLWLRCRTV